MLISVLFDFRRFNLSLETAYKFDPNVTSTFLCIEVIDSSVKKFSYNELPLTTSGFFFYIFLLFVSWTQDYQTEPL